MTGWRLWTAWTAACALGEAIGIGIAAGAAILIARVIGEPGTAPQRAVVLAGMVAAGTLEGLTLGALQSVVLRERIGSVSARAWALTTAAVAAAGWLMGMLPSALSAPPSVPGEPADTALPLTVALVFSAVFGLVAGSVFGAAQWLVLRRHARRAKSWIAANALGWMAALPWIYVAGSMPGPETPLGRAFALAVVAGAVAGASLGAVTGVFMLRLTPAAAKGGAMICAQVMKTDVARCPETLSAPG